MTNKSETKKRKKLVPSQLFENNRFLLILSVLVAFVSWFLVSTTVNPNANTTIKDVPVTIDLTDTAAENNGLSVVSDKEITVDVAVRGKSYEIGNLDAEDFKVVPVNLGEVTEPGMHELTLQVTPIVDLSEDTEAVAEPRRISVQFDRMEKKTFQLEASAPYKEAAEGYYIDQYIASPKELTISGPESIVSQISRCVVENKDKMEINNSSTIDGTLILYDANGQVIDDTYLSYPEDTQFKIAIPLYKQETLPFTFEFYNVPEGIDTDALEYTIEPVDELTVGIPVDAATDVSAISLGRVDFRKIDIKKSLTFDVSLLAGYVNIDDINQVNVTFLTDEYDKTYISTSNLVVTNVPSGYEVEIISTKISDIRFIGKKDQLEGLTPADVVATIDCSQIQNFFAGQQRVPVTITANNGKQVWAVGEKSALISIKEISEE
ncbi:MAG: YbbR-like domain-containing protein [Massiliimalia sp.]|jgi:YbbR domain-containing protein